MTKRNLLIITIGLLILSILGGLILWRPKLQNFLSLRQELERKKQDVNIKNAYFKNLNDISNKLKKYSEEIDKIDSALPIKPSIPAFFHFIKKISMENGLVLQNLVWGETSNSKKEPKIKEIHFSLAVSGSYPAFKNFLSALYENSRMIEVDAISFSSNKENDPIEFSLALTTYAYKLTEEDIEKTEIKLKR